MHGSPNPSIVRDPTIAPRDWIDTSSVGEYYFHPLRLKDTTNFAKAVNARIGNVADELYLSQMVDIHKFENKQLVPKSVLPVRGVRILYQQDAAGTRYGASYVRMALPTAFVDKVADRFEAWGFPISKTVVKDQTIIRLGGVEYTVFTADLKKTRSYWAQDDTQTEFKMKPLLNQQRTDLIASVGFKVCLKYKGAYLHDRNLAPMSIAFEPAFVYTTDIAPVALDPNPPPTRPAPSVSQLSQEVTASPRVAQLLSQPAL